ncbi:MAG TPA: ABC transporter permease [Propionibacteriaceae bacterium]|nr:ABC transporter permease [Propionibacteriaceae bacterium]
MTTRTRAPITAAKPTRFSPRRFLALAGAETKILLRNRTALFVVATMPVFMALFFMTFTKLPSLGMLLTGMILGMALLFVIYYTMVTSLVARREQLVLKRLNSGEATPIEILLAPAVPLWVATVVQTGLAALAARYALDSGALHWWALIPAVVLGSAAWTGLAVLSAPLTRTVESAQLTTMPAILVALMLSGLSLPLALMPTAVQQVAMLLPLAPVVDLVSYAFTGMNLIGEQVSATAMVKPVVVLLAWTAGSMWLGMRIFRWDPRT